MTDNAEDLKSSQENDNLGQDYAEYMRRRTEFEEINSGQNNKRKHKYIILL